MWKKSIAFVLLCLLCVTLLAGCGCGSGAQSGTSGGTQNSGSGGTQSGGSGGTQNSGSGGTGSEISSMGGTTVGAVATEDVKYAEHIDIIVNETQVTVINPTLSAGTGAPSYWIYLMNNDRLVEMNESEEILPMLAKEFHTDDYITFTFKLRDDVYFHDGNKFTSEDVVWTIESALADASSPAHNMWIRVVSVTAPDPYTVEMVMDSMYVDWYRELSRNRAGFLCKAAYEADPNGLSWGMIGNGPFKVVNFSSNDYCTLERFDGYWGEPPPTKSVTLWTIPEMSTRMVMLENGEAQVSFQMTPEDCDALAVDPRFQIFPVRLNEPVGIGFNNQGEELIMDINFRLAIAHALNCDEIAMVALGNWAEAPKDGNMWGPISQYRLEGLPKREYNPELAKEYLAKTSYKGQTIKLMTTSAQNIRAAEYIQMQLSKVGITISVEQMDHAAFMAAHMYDPQSERQIYLFSLSMSQDAISNLNSLNGRSTNRLNVNDDYIWDLREQYYLLSDDEGRRDVAYKLQQYIYDKMICYATFFRIQAVVATKGIGGLKLSANQFEHVLRGIYWIKE